MQLHPSYGDLEMISAKTNGRCHLCGDAADLDDYGLVRLLGRDATSIDHLVPRAHGGDDDHENLRLAHHGCNSARGVRDPVGARVAMRGLPWAPLSAEGRAIATGTVAVGACVTGGLLFAKRDEEGHKQFNPGAAALSGALAGLLTYALT